MNLTYLSLGAGVQSTALLILSAEGKLGVPRADLAIFADTQDEPAWVYEHLSKLEAWSSIPIVRVTKGHLGGDVVDRHKGGRTRFAAIPAFTPGGDGRPVMLRRQCTRQYKIDPIEREVRAVLGVFKGQRVGKRTATALIGISLDEAIRMKPSRTKWITNRYPLVDARLRRDDCVKIIEASGFEAPKKSACVFCPFHDDAYWLNLKQRHPAEWERACRFDEAIRDMSKSRNKGQVFLHRGLRPLRVISLRHERQLPLLSADGFGGECEGVCGV